MNEQHPYIKILFSQETDEDEITPESMWASKMGEHYRIENIPFLIRDIAFHDVVKAEEVDGILEATGIVEESGHSTVRIFFLSDKLKEVRAFLKNQGCGSEKGSDKFIAVDIPPEVEYKLIKEYLEKGEEKGFWEYEEGCLAHEI